MEADGEDGRRRRSFFSSKSCSTRTMGTIVDIAEGLVKNSVDSGARRIEINFSLQHFSMSCTDDGCGIEPQEMKSVASCRADGRADGELLGSSDGRLDGELLGLLVGCCVMGGGLGCAVGC